MPGRGKKNSTHRSTVAVAGQLTGGGPLLPPLALSFTPSLRTFSRGLHGHTEKTPPGGGVFLVSLRVLLLQYVAFVDIFYNVSGLALEKPTDGPNVQPRHQLAPP